MKLARQMLPGGKKRPAGEGLPADAVTLPFYAGCAIPQDHELHAVVHEVAAGFGVRLDESADAGCCGHPSRGTVDSLFASRERVYTACPACDASLDEAGMEAVPLWDALTERAGRSSSISLTAASGSASSRTSAASPTATPRWRRSATPPSRPAPRWPSTTRRCTTAAAAPSAACTAAPPRAARGSWSSPSRQQAPVVTTCVLCRDNLRSAARELKLDVPVHFWPEFFRAVPTASEERTDD